MDEQLILDRYRLIERLAVGGSAEVWRAHDEQLDRPVAVKRLHPHLLPDEPSRRRLAAEARAAASLSHPVIVDVYDVDATGEAPALVMELVDGESLGTRIERDGPLEPREAAAVTADLAEALYQAHQRGVIHRDVKPGNVLLARDGRTRLVDFGIAHSLADASARLTLTGTVVGTLRAMAPEQLAGGPITPRTDLYGLGVVLHEALTGRPPHESGSPVELAQQQRAGPPLLGGLEPGLAAVVAACLSYEPANRPLHAGAMASALRDWLAGDATAALALAPPPSFETVDASAVTQPIPVVAAAPHVASTDAPPRRRLPFAAVAIVGLLLLAGVALASAFGLGRSDGAIGGEPIASASASASPSPTATPRPEWLAKLVEDVAKECGEGTALTLEAEEAMASMTEEDAKAYAEDQRDACKEAADGDGEEGEGGGGGNAGGNGGGNGNGNGRGNDD
ncbi:MAG TPA: serine/threonine-protein kinase [Candidatus Limnocylindria bacterium]